MRSPAPASVYGITLPIKSNASTLSAGSRIKLCAHLLCPSTHFFSPHFTCDVSKSLHNNPHQVLHSLREREVELKFQPLCGELHIHTTRIVHSKGCSALQELQCQECNSRCALAKNCFRITRLGLTRGM